MRADPNYLREHYRSLSDEALLAIERGELVDLAQQCYDDEMKARGLAQRGRQRPMAQRAEEAVVEEPEMPEEPELHDGDEPPDWAEDAAEVYSVAVHPGMSAGEDAAAHARGALEAAGIPCYLERVEVQEEKNPHPPIRQRWRLMAPAQFNLQAMSVLSRELDNPEFEAVWKAQLENLSDEELLEMRPEVVFCGLFDRVERVTRAYEDEIALRRLRE